MRLTDTYADYFTMTRTATKAAVKHGFTREAIADAFYSPKRVYPSATHEGQWRVVNRDICLVGVYDDRNGFKVITLYPNGSVAPRAAA